MDEVAVGEPLLNLYDLEVNFQTRLGEIPAVRGISLEVRSGEVLVILGESGSGKSVTCRAVMGLLPETAKVTGHVYYQGRDILGLSAKGKRQLRAHDFGMIFQNPIGALNPTLTVGDHLEHRARKVGGMSREEASGLTDRQLRRVGLGEIEGFRRRYPHEVSGGQAQRVLIAVASMFAPAVLIADEPTTALDATLRAGILDDLREVVTQTGSALVLITHNVSVARRVADRIGVMYAGRLVEVGQANAVITRPEHPYTRGLLASVPKLRGGRDQRLAGISGVPPNPERLPPGCPFAPRCPEAVESCTDAEPNLVGVGSSGIRVACAVRATQYGEGR